MKYYKETVAPEGFVSGMIVGTIIRDAMDRRNVAWTFDRYESIFNTIRKEAWKLHNGKPKTAGKWYYLEKDVCRIALREAKKMAAA